MRKKCQRLDIKYKSMNFFFQIIYLVVLFVLFFVAIVASPKETDAGDTTGLVAIIFLWPLSLVVLVVVGIGSLFYIAFNGWRDNTTK